MKLFEYFMCGLWYVERLTDLNKKFFKVTIGLTVSYYRFKEDNYSGGI